MPTTVVKSQRRLASRSATACAFARLITPVIPAFRGGWSEDQLADLITRESMIGVALVPKPA
jgi:hypothetical protein